MRILVVEDQEKIAEFTRKGLKENGFSVEVCRDGNSAFELATSQEFDALVRGLAPQREVRYKGGSSASGPLAATCRLGRVLRLAGSRDANAPSQKGRDQRGMK